LLGDCSAATIFKVTSASTTTPGTQAIIGFGAGAALGGDGFTIDTHATLQHFDQVTYFVGSVPNSAPTRSALYRFSQRAADAGQAAEELVENVEDMDVVYGIGAAGAATTIAATSATKFEHADLVTAANDWRNVVSVRVSVLAVGDQNGAVPVAQTILLRGTGVDPVPTAATAYPAPDTRLRQVFTATAAVRDRVL
jgi:hypothetical protein